MTSHRREKRPCNTLRALRKRWLAMDGTVSLTIVIEAEDGLYVATCRELDIASQGESVEDAMQHVLNATTLYLNVLEEDGEIERVFREREIEIERRLSTDYQVNMPAGVFATVRSLPIRRPALA